MVGEKVRQVVNGLKLKLQEEKAKRSFDWILKAFLLKLWNLLKKLQTNDSGLVFNQGNHEQDIHISQCLIKS